MQIDDNDDAESSGCGREQSNGKLATVRDWTVVEAYWGLGICQFWHGRSTTGHKRLLCFPTPFKQLLSSTVNSHPHRLTHTAEPSYINTPYSELNESKEADTPSRKALRQAVKVLRDDSPRRHVFAKYGVVKTTEYRILNAESSHKKTNER